MHDELKPEVVRFRAKLKAELGHLRTELLKMERAIAAMDDLDENEAVPEADVSPVPLPPGRPAPVVVPLVTMPAIPPMAVAMAPPVPWNLSDAIRHVLRGVTHEVTLDKVRALLDHEHAELRPYPGLSTLLLGMARRGELVRGGSFRVPTYRVKALQAVKCTCEEGHGHAAVARRYDEFRQTM